MDSRMGVEKNNPVSLSDVPVSDVPDSAMPVSRAKQGLPSKITKACSGIASTVNESSPSVNFPDKTRTLASMDSLLHKAPHAFDFRFVTSDDELRKLLVAQTCDEHRDVTLISHPDDLSQANLVTRLSISDDGRHTLGSGKLFEGSQPMTLVLDIRKLSSEDLPKFNDLLDPNNPSLYDKVSQQKRSLGEHVALLVLADPDQLASVGQREDAPGADAPGADFWRRINRPGNTWQFDAQSGNAPAMDINQVPPVLAELSTESAMDDDNTVVIDCHLHSHWRQLLLGGPGVDKQGRIQHLPGRLELLKAGQRVILKGANWQDLAFEQTIRQMLAQQCFESNGKVCRLPDNVQFYQMPVGNDELRSLFQNLSCSLEKQGDKQDDEGLDQEQPPQNPIIINESTIREWLSPIAIAPEGYAVPNHCLLAQVQAGGAVTVTSPLNEENWFRLLGSLQTIRETTGLKPRLQVAHAKGQPKALGLTEHDGHPLPGLPKKVSDQAAIDTVTYQQHAQVRHWINQQPQTPLVIQVNDQTSFSQLFDNIHITSEQKAYFGRRQSKLQEALTAGKPVVFLGLERNPALQQLLEPLVAGQPVLVNGQLQAYPQARVTLLWPESTKSPSSVLNSMLATGKPCPEVDLWDINASRYEIPRTELPEQALNELYEAFKTVPDHLCNPLPEITEGLLNNLILAARRAQQADQSPEFLPRHWRKAINSVITHGTRQHPSVRDFMKVACWHLLPDKTTDKDHNAWVDPDQLHKVINSAPRLDREFVKENLWPLIRAFDPNVFKQSQLSYQSSSLKWDLEEVLDRLCALIVAHGPEEHRQAMACQLKVDPEAAKQYPPLAIRPSRQIKRLQDALASDWQLSLPLGQTRSDAIQSLASDCFHIARTANSEAERIERIQHRLAESMAWPGSANMPLSALARDLYHGEISQKDRESRRLSRLYDRLTDSPVLFLQGETGTGKSYFSAKMARASGQASVISLGPSDSEQTLMKRWQWQQHADGDRSMTPQNRALMKWAKTESDKDGEYITLVLDEANLAQAGLLASLNGLWEPQPCIYVNGHPVKVSLKHRVILTGNPDHYAGRQMDPALKEKLPRAYYPRLDQAFLRDRVVEPALVRHLQEHLTEQQINDIAHSASKSVMTLWQHYQELLPEHEFTPRDLTDICSWVGWYLDRAQPACGSVTCEQINSLIQLSFRDVLGPEITETHQDALSALEIWFAARYEPENTLSDRVHNKTLQEMQQTFSTVSEKIRPDFDTSGSAVRELAQRLGQDLSRCQQAYHRKIKHGGRQATLIEGPAGRGKDATLNLVIESVRQQAEQRQESMPKVHYLNACDCSWDKVCEKIQKAKIKGGIVVISEMNLIDSQHLEGELNDILAGDAHPGFHLFATINPPEFSGRKPLSPALKGRFRHLPIRQYNATELQTIAEKVLPESLQGTFAAKMLTEKHCRLRAHLQGKKLPLQPTSLDLQNVARAITRGGDFSEKAVHQCLNQHYRLYLMAAKLSLEELPVSSAVAMRKSEFNSGLCQWFNQTVSDIDRPWLIRSSHLNSVDEKNHEIRIKTRPTEEETKTELIRMAAQKKWQASGLSLNPDKSDDIFTQALYRHWQQRWFAGEFSLTEVDANSVFPLTKEQAQTLKMRTCKPYLKKADKQIQAWNARDVQCWPAFWHQISALPNRLVNDLINKTSAISGDEAPEPYIPEVEEEKAPALDRGTNYEDRDNSVAKFHKVFNTQHHPKMYRWQAKDIRVTAGGEIKQIDLDGKHFLGVETLTPKRLPGKDQEVILTRDQTLGTLEVSPKNGQCPLPSLTASDTIVALRLEPNVPFKLTRDQYTGLHTLFIPLAKAYQSFQCTYVIEPRKPGGKTAAKEAFFDVQCSEGIKSVLKELFANISRQPAKIQGPLRKIIDAKNIRQRINAITEYCEQFSGAAKPEESENFFRFLVTNRQGSCRHRAPVFVAFCRYFGIPSRQIQSLKHVFAEYSVDGGQTWESVNLGGASGESTVIAPDFQHSSKAGSSGSRPNFGIPGWEISSGIHSFGGFSADGSQTLGSVNLDAAPRKSAEIAPDFQHSSKAGSPSSRPNKINIDNLLRDADSAQQQALAEVLRISQRALKKAHETNTARLETHLTPSEMILKLWKKKDLASFSMGVSILNSPETKALYDPEREFIGVVYGENDRRYNPMTEAVIQILSDSDEDQVSDPLKSLYVKMIVPGEARPGYWLRSIVKILNGSDLSKRSVIQFAGEALKSGWLDLVPVEIFQGQEKIEHHKLLVRLESVDELKADASHCLKQWYTELFSREKNNHQWQFFYSIFQKNKKYASLVSRSHDAVSPFLQGKIASSSLQKSWTHQPEGIPNIERLLVNDPAFEQLSSVRANQRPVIILGQPYWNDTTMYKKVEALLQRMIASDPDNLKPLLEEINQYNQIKKQFDDDMEALKKEHSYRECRHSGFFDKRYQSEKNDYEKKRLEIENRYNPALKLYESSIVAQKPQSDLVNKCTKSIQQAFSFYLYGLANSKGGYLKYCWADAAMGHNAVKGPNDGNCCHYGAHDPSSPEELYAMMTWIRSSDEFQESVADAYLRQAQNASDALVLKSGELTIIAEEFLNSVNLNSLSDALES
ncbi:AAA family ATPase [Endozoicomonas sp. 8E]|uniref:AAA family ATPase n=1 Tax=Endozoicomonas sp. 8E TaxID=3035692 RepID=UPI002938F6F6|nr:AAA family ATPase [Endozoicomonas sp. 8E]WOG28847.1 AAA family ATPase [Endozoicomonas sp. 8E]